MEREVARFRKFKESGFSGSSVCGLVSLELNKEPNFIELECPSTKTLDSLGRSYGGLHKIPLEERLRVFEKILSAVVEIHGADLLHLDLQPSSILIDDSNPFEVKVWLRDVGPGNELRGEFSWLEHISRKSSSSANLYWAPELFELGALPSVRTDIFALGVLLGQLVLADFSRSPLERLDEIKDPILRDDIEHSTIADPEERLGFVFIMLHRLMQYEERKHYEKRKHLNERGLHHYRTRNVKEELRFDESFERLLKHVAHGEFDEARSLLAMIVVEFPREGVPLSQELTFLFDLRTSLDDERIRWSRDETHWCSALWVMSKKWNAWREKTGVSETEAQVNGGEIKKAGEGAEELNTGPSDSPQFARIDLPAEAKGEKLERAAFTLLDTLFQFGVGEEQIVEELVQQRRGTQMGFDLKVKYATLKDGNNVRCYVECKATDKVIGTPDIAGKLVDVVEEEGADRIDHWVLIAPQAKLSNKLQSYIDRWAEPGGNPFGASFTIQIWAPSTRVDELFGLVPEIYHYWFESKTDEDPALWSEERRSEVRRRWLERLAPPLRLPGGFEQYVLDSRFWRTGYENQDIASKVGEEYIEPRCLDSSGVECSGDLHSNVLAWLGDDTSKTLLLLGEFGEGKSVFTYQLTTRLIASFKRKPREGWLPIRFSLRYFSSDDEANARRFIEVRMNELGIDWPAWRKILELNRVLVILDGIDEMTQNLDRGSLDRSHKRLVSLCEEELQGAKILMTCRTGFWAALPYRDSLSEILGPALELRIKPFGRGMVIEKLMEAANTDDRRERLNRIQMIHDPVGLARKALFFEMVSTTLWDIPLEEINKIGVYDRYCRQALERKARDLRESSTFGINSDSKLIKNMLRILEGLAIDMQESGKAYACLRKFGTLAKSLWGELVSVEDGTQSDAVNRVGIRSLLHRVEFGVDEADSDSWPVDFCHRSVREFLVAKSIYQDLGSSPERAKYSLARSDLSVETVAFCAEFLKMSNDITRACSNLRTFVLEGANIHEGESLGFAPKRLARNAMSLLLKAVDGLEEEDWSDLHLDGVDFSGADLSGKKFCRTSLKDAIFDNAILKNSDFSGADLTGVRLEETADVRSISLIPAEEAFLASYSDGKVLRWDLNRKGGLPQVLATGDGVRQAWQLPRGDGLCVASEGKMTLYFRREGRLTPQCSFNVSLLVALNMLR